MANILVELQVAMKKERKKIENMENNNNLYRGSIEQVAAPVIRMESVEDKMKTELNSLRRFTSNCSFRANRMEDLMWEDQAREEAMQEQQVRMDELEAENQRQAMQFTDDNIMDE